MKLSLLKLKLWWLSIAVLSIVFLTKTAHSQWFPTEPGRQRKAASYLVPASLSMPADQQHDKVTVFKVRCYADNDYRVGGVRAQDRVRFQLDAINRVIEPTLGVRLEMERYERWQRTDDPSDLSRVLKELEQLDTGAGVDWVIGFVTGSQRARRAVQRY